ncbi:unnamed protein product [Chilo suppressalis]|uniref:Major facilitator superfamily (MFS) profile domain-containing protein n=1 Tax=Chilo suppressalis TaxID=168631 RepID=A0ABN8L398_CHISP|nr:unnamed protein product [Chilo suppressalis]
MEPVGSNSNESETETGGNTNNSDDQPTQPHKFAVYLEFPLLLTMLGIAISGAPTSNLLMYRTCLHSLNHTVEECQSFLLPEAINHTQELEDEVQHYATFVTTARTVLQAVVPAVMSLFIGVWSDKHGRKPLVVWPVLGLFISSGLTVIYSMLQSLGPWWLVAVVLPFSLSGGFAVLYIGSMCYASDTSTIENRTVRILYMEMVYIIASTLGSYSSPYILKGVGDITFLLLMETTLYAFAYAVTVVFVNESLLTATPGTFHTVLNVDHVREFVKVCFKRKPNHGRAITLLVVIATGLFGFPVYGISGLMYLYTRNKLHWTMKDYTTYKSISTVMWFLGSLLAIRVLQRYFRIRDIIFSLVAYMSDSVEYLIKGLATTTWHMYLGSVVSLFGTTSGTFLRSFLSKILPQTDIAKTFALMGATQALCPLLAPILYNTLYVYTIKTFPGAFLVLSFGIGIISLSLLSIVPCLQRRAGATYQTINEDDEQE